MFDQAREQKQLLGEMGAAIHALHDPLHGELLLGAVLCHECDLRLHLDGRQRGLQLVRGVRSTTRSTMQLSSLVRTGTTSKWFATNPRPDLPSSGLARLGRLSDQTLGVRYSAVFGRNGGQGERNVDCKTLSADSSTEVQSGAKVLRDACDD